MWSLTWGRSEVPLFTREQPQPERALWSPRNGAGLSLWALLCSSGVWSAEGLSCEVCLFGWVCAHVTRAGRRQGDVWVCTSTDRVRPWLQKEMSDCTKGP